MPPFDREGALKSAEKALRQGRIEAAIAEYVKVVEAQPRDWNSANALGDLYVRATQLDQGLQQFTRIADQLAAEGFYPKAAAVFKKILKLKPDDEYALLQSGDLAARQGTLAEAKRYFQAVADRRKARGDRQGVAEIAIRLGTLDPDDLDARLAAAQLAAESGDAVTALREFREVAARYQKKDRRVEAVTALRAAFDLDPSDLAVRTSLALALVASGDLGAARQYLSAEAAGVDPTLWLALGEIELTANRASEGRAAITQALALDRARAEVAIALGCRLAEANADAGYQCIEAVADAALADDDYAAAAMSLQAFTFRVPSHLVALMRLVEVCVDGSLDATMSQAQRQLAEAYLGLGRGLEARIISEDLVEREPGNEADVDCFRRALVMLGESDPDAIIADRVSGDGLFRGEPLDLNEGVSFESLPVPDTPVVAAAAPMSAPVDASIDELTAIEIDLSDAFDEFPSPVPVTPPPARSLDQVFRGLRDESNRQSSEEAAAEQYRLALTYHEMGMTEDAIRALEGATRSPRQRFDAASMLGRLYLEREELPQAIEWLERAAEAPAPTADAGRALLYDLAETLEAMGESSRALAVFVELESESGGYRDAAARINRLSKVQARG